MSKLAETNSMIDYMIKLDELGHNIDNTVILVDIAKSLAMVADKLCGAESETVLDKIKAEIKDTLYVDSLIFGELIDFQNGKISADDVIEEFNRVARMEILHILDKYKSESENKE